jgi:hypothetical protein
MLRPEMNGLIIRIFNSNNNGNDTYFVDEGKARHITIRDTIGAMFNSNAHLFDFTFNHADMIDIGASMDNGHLFLYDNKYYIWDEHKYRHIVDPATMNRYNFNWDADKGPLNPADFPKLVGSPIQWIPKFNGNRVKTHNDPAAYLIDKGKKRHIVDPDTFYSLFGHNDEVQLVESLDDIPLGPDLSNRTTRLVTANDQPGGAHIYLLDQGLKRIIEGTYAMDSIGYGFWAGHVTNMAWSTLLECPDGSPIVWPEPSYS